MARGQITVRAARWSATHPWRAIAMWVVVVIACFAIGSVTGTKESKNEGDIGEVTRADNIVKSGNFDDPDVESVLITAPSGQLDQAEANKAAAVVIQRMRALGGVAEVAQPMPSPKNDAVIVRVTMKDVPEGSDDDAGFSRCSTRPPRSSSSTRTCGSRRSADCRSTRRSTRRSARTSSGRRCSACR